jgi:hypothetical protein
MYVMAEYGKSCAQAEGQGGEGEVRVEAEAKEYYITHTEHYRRDKVEALQLFFEEEAGYYVSVFFHGMQISRCSLIFQKILVVNETFI